MNGATNAVSEGDLLWTPSAERVERANLTHYLKWLAARGRRFASYADLWQWSIDDQDGFWGSLWDTSGFRPRSPMTGCSGRAPCRERNGFPVPG